MKKINPLYLAIIMAALVFVSFRQDNESSPGNLGDVKYSVLAPEEFIAQNGKGWILLDDKATEKLANSDLGRLGVVPRLPDARGVFIRGANMGRDTLSGDAEATRLPLSSQADAFQGHFHHLSGPVDCHDAQTVQAKTLVATGMGHSEISEKGARLDTRNYINNAKTDGVNGEPRISSETRPKNIALYTYIKINDK